MAGERSLDAIEAMDRIASAWRRVASARLRPFGITLAQYELIGLSRRRGALSLSAAAAALDWDRPTLSLVSRACLNLGWLKRRRIITDKRSARIELTGAGEELLDSIEAGRLFDEASLGDPFDILSADDRAEVARLLDRVARRAADLWGRGAEGPASIIE